MRHVHIGAGRFGLGFVGWISKHLGLELFIFNRANPATGILSDENALIASQGRYDIEYQDAERESILVTDLSIIESGDNPRSLTTLVGDKETRLLTVSLKGKHGIVTPHLFRGLLSRADIEGCKLYVLACENEVTIDELRNSILKHGTSEERQHVERVCEFIPCVVDRICSNEPRIRNGGVTILTEKYGRLSLGPSVARSFFEDRLSLEGRNSQLVKVEKYFEVAVMKKKWLVNGPHLLLAIDAMWRGTSDFQQYAKDNQQFVRRILEEFATGLLHICGNKGTYPDDFVLGLEEELSSEIWRIQQRFENEPDGVGRIASRFVEPTTRNPHALEKFFQNMSYKLLEPAYAYREREGFMPSCISTALIHLSELIARGAFLRRNKRPFLRR